MYVGKLASTVISRLFKLYADCDEESKEKVDDVKLVKSRTQQFLDLCFG